MDDRTKEASRLNRKHNARPHLARKFPVMVTSRFVPMTMECVPVNEQRAETKSSHTDEIQ